MGGTLIHINTNGSKLDAESMRELYNIHLDSIKFSFQGADEGTYGEMRLGGDYKNLLDTIRQFYCMRGSREYPFIQVSTTITGESIEQIDDFKNDISEYCDSYSIGYTKLSHLDVNQMDITEEEKQKIRALQKEESCQHSLRKVCPEAFDKLSVNWNGDVTLCCSDYDNFMVVGNILDADLKTIFNSNAADMYRRIIAQGQYGRIKCCSTCYEYMPLNV